MDFKNGHLVDTDYWISEGGALAERAWLMVRDGVWHVLLPRPPAADRLGRVVAMPVTASEEPARWQWALLARQELNVRISLGCVLGHPPPLPVPGARLHRRLVLYAYWRRELTHVTYNFGHFTPGALPVLVETELDIVRPKRTADGQWWWKERT